jgi:hypothetical protein
VSLKRAVSLAAALKIEKQFEEAKRNKKSNAQEKVSIANLWNFVVELILYSLSYF